MTLTTPEQATGSEDIFTRFRRRGIRVRHLCLSCREQRSVCLCRGVVKADAHHTLCFRCYRSVIDRARASRLARGIHEFAPVARKETR